MVLFMYIYRYKLLGKCGLFFWENHFLFWQKKKKTKKNLFNNKQSIVHYQTKFSILFGVPREF